MHGAESGNPLSPHRQPDDTQADSTLSQGRSGAGDHPTHESCALIVIHVLWLFATYISICEEDVICITFRHPDVPAPAGLGTAGGSLIRGIREQREKRGWEGSTHSTAAAG